MKKITIGLLMLFGLSACSTAGGLSVAGQGISYDLPIVKYEKHESVIYPANPRR